jgi:hypothetical protein
MESSKHRTRFDPMDPTPLVANIILHFSHGSSGAPSPRHLSEICSIPLETTDGLAPQTARRIGRTAKPCWPFPQFQRVLI